MRIGEANRKIERVGQEAETEKETCWVKDDDGESESETGIKSQKHTESESSNSCIRTWCRDEFSMNKNQKTHFGKKMIDTGDRKRKRVIKEPRNQIKRNEFKLEDERREKMIKGKLMPSICFHENHETLLWNH